MTQLKFKKKLTLLRATNFSPATANSKQKQQNGPKHDNCKNGAYK